MLPTKDTTDVSIDEYVSVLKRRWLWIVVPALVLGGFALFRGVNATPVYSAQAQLLLQQNTFSDVVNPGQALQDPNRALQNELVKINSELVRDAVAEAYGGPVSVRALAGGEDDVIIISASAATGREAAEKANVYATTYQDVRIETQLEDITGAMKVVQQQIDDFSTQIEELDAPLAAIDEQLLLIDTNDPRYNVLVNSRERERQRTDAARNEARNQLNEYQNRGQVLQLSERLVPTGGIQVVNAATVPSTPISPTVPRDVVQSIIIGLFLGLALAFARDQFDDALRSKADVERAARGVPTLGLVPFDTASSDVRAPELSTLVAPMSATAESYRGLRTALQYTSLERPIKILQITSASAGETKTTSLSNLAMTFALSGKRVVVVDCDLRKPKVHRFMQVDGTKGFTSVVLGDLTLDEALQTSPLHPNIDVLPSGYLPPNPSELLNHDRTDRILRSLTERYAIVFVDCPPVLPVTDALVVSRYADATLFMVMANRTTKRNARRAIEMLRQVGAPLVGTVISGAADQDTYGSLYEYYGYVRRSSVPIIGRFLGRKGADVPTSTQDMLPQNDDNNENNQVLP